MTHAEYYQLDEHYTLALREAEDFLASTDYKVIKAAEGVDTLTDELKAQRQAARDTINEMRANLEALWAQSGKLIEWSEEQKAEWEREHPREEETC